MKKADVAISVYGKPFQTAVTLLSLQKYSDEHIGSIFLTLERVQPFEVDYSFLFERLKDKLIIHKPKYWFSYKRIDPLKFKNTDYRHTVRYQYAWEKSECDYIFFTHNDVLYKDDIVGLFLENIGENAGIGQIGQCWNCPAFSARKCDSDHYLEYRPDYSELAELYKTHPPRRETNINREIYRQQPWTLPECRLNEWFSLINLKKARPVTMPHGDCLPAGYYDFDTGIRWFRDMSARGFEFKNFETSKHATHAWANPGGNGHSALSDKNLYDDSEKIAKQMLMDEYGFSEDELPVSKNLSFVRKKISKFFFLKS